MRVLPLAALLALAGACGDDAPVAPGGELPFAELVTDVRPRGDDGGPTVDTDPDVSEAVEDVSEPPDLWEPPSCEPIIQAEPSPRAGVAYIAHFDSPILRAFDVSGEAPVDRGATTLEAVVRDMALDEVHDLLVAAHDTARTVSVTRVYRPAGGDFTPPSAVASIPLGDDTPRIVRVDPLRQRLYVVASPPLGASPAVANLWVFSLAAGSLGEPLESGPVPIPTTESAGTDPMAGLLFTLGSYDHVLRAWDLTEPGLPPAAGEPPALSELYPQQSADPLLIRGLRVAPWAGRVLAARDQGTLSELVALSYPAVYTGAPVCPPRPDHDALVPLPDFLDVDAPRTTRPHLLSARSVLTEPKTGQLFLIGAAWSGETPAALVVPMNAQLQPGPGCGHYTAPGAESGFGCFFYRFESGVAAELMQSDGVACLDPTHGVVVGTSTGASGQLGSALLTTWSYDTATLSMSPQVPAGGVSVGMGALPIAAVCH